MWGGSQGLLLGRPRSTVPDCLTVSRPQRLLSERHFHYFIAVKTNKLCDPCTSAFTNSSLDIKLNVFALQYFTLEQLAQSLNLLYSSVVAAA